MSDEHLRNDTPRSGYGDAVAVLKFAEVMITKLGENNWKKHWTNSRVSTVFLIDRLKEEVVELQRACERRGNKSHVEIQREAADVANFAMMIADHARRRSA